VGNKVYRKLSFEDLAEIAKKYKTKREFYNEDSSAFVTACRTTHAVPLKGHERDENFIGPVQFELVRVLDIICTHMYRGHFKWTHQMIANAAKLYDSRTEFAKKNRQAYSGTHAKHLEWTPITTRFVEKSSSPDAKQSVLTSQRTTSSLTPGLMITLFG